MRGVICLTYIELDVFITHKWDGFSSPNDHKVLRSAGDFAKGGKRKIQQKLLKGLGKDRFLIVPLFHFSNVQLKE